MKFLSLTLAAMLLVCQAASAQDTKEEKQLINWRLSRINIHNIGIGASLGMNENMLLSPHVYYRAGSNRNLINAEGGLKYTLCGPTDFKDTDIVRAQYLGAYMEAHLNFLRWRTGAVYLGPGIGYDWGLSASYRTSASNTTVRDNAIAKGHANASGKVGMKFNHWDASIYFVFNMAPLMDQKHIFESSGYNYEQVYSQTHERCRIGISLSYMIPLQ